MRWFLLPSEAAQLLSGKQVSGFPMTPPFTPLQWKNGSPVSEGAKSTGAEYMEPSDRTSTRSAQKGSSFLSEKATTSQDNMKPRNENDRKMLDCSDVVNGEIGNENFEDSIYDDEKCDECEERDLSASQGRYRNQKPLLKDDTKSLGNGKCSAVNMKTENMGLKLKDAEQRTEKGHDGKHFAETGVCGFSGSKKDEKTSRNEDNTGYSFPVDKEVPPTRESKTFDQASNQGTSSEEEAVIRDSNSLTAGPTVVCQRKPRNKKQNDVIPGKPQFYHPPKSIFKPSTQVREPLLEMLIL